MKALVILPTIPDRPTKNVIDAFLSQGASLRVYLNGFECIPKSWAPHGFHGMQFVHYYLNKTQRGPAIRYSQPVEEFDFAFFADDDIVYPKEYIERSIEHLKEFGKKTAITWHASYWAKGETRFERRFGIQAISKSAKYWRVPYTGSGALAMHAEDFNSVAGPVPLLYEYEDDIWISSRLAKKGIELIRPPCEKRWIEIAIYNDERSLWRRAVRDEFKSRNLALETASKECPAWKLDQWYGFSDPRKRQ